MSEILVTLLAKFPIFRFLISHSPVDGERKREKKKKRKIRGKAINVELKERTLRMHCSLLCYNWTRFHASYINHGLLPMPS